MEPCPGHISTQQESIMNELEQFMARTKKYIEQQQVLFGDTRYTAETQPEKQPKVREKAVQTEGEVPPAGKKAAKPDVQSQPVVVQPGREPEAWELAPSLPVMQELIQDCKKCRLWETRTKLVFGTGNPNADIMVIGEAPGADEDASGKPFVGRAGQLLTKILAAINLDREEVYIANIIKSRPPGNRRPMADEVEACEPYLFKQMEFIKPKFILALGLTSVNTLLRSDYRMGDIRGKALDYRGATLIATYHPAALLRNPQWKAATWEDVKALRKMYDEYLEKKGD
jgi:uracil-DNA glycosylase family 4